MKIHNVSQKLCINIKSQSGMALGMALAFVAFMVITMLALSTMVQTDIRFVSNVAKMEQARSVAEAGLNAGLADIKANGFASRSDFSGNLDTGSYSVTYTTVSGRHLIESVGTVSGTSSTVSAEIKDSTPTSLNYLTGAGGDIRITSEVAGNAITGDMHANDDIDLKASPAGSASLSITGVVSAVENVVEGNDYNVADAWDTTLSINTVSGDDALVYEDAASITFPTFDYTTLKQLAEDTGTDYYSGDQTFTGGTLSPTCGLIYIDGDLTINSGTVTLNGGIIADDIIIEDGGGLTQVKSGTRNMIVARDGDIEVEGTLIVGEALVYADEDIEGSDGGYTPSFNINGLLLAGGDIELEDDPCTITYTYTAVSPADMQGPEGEDIFIVVSWNQ